MPGTLARRTDRPTPANRPASERWLSLSAVRPRSPGGLDLLVHLLRPFGYPRELGFQPVAFRVRAGRGGFNCLRCLRDGRTVSALLCRRARRTLSLFPRRRDGRTLSFLPGRRDGRTVSFLAGRRDGRTVSFLPGRRDGRTVSFLAGRWGGRTVSFLPGRRGGRTLSFRLCRRGRCRRHLPRPQQLRYQRVIRPPAVAASPAGEHNQTAKQYQPEQSSDQPTHAPHRRPPTPQSRYGNPYDPKDLAPGGPKRHL